LNRSLSLLLFVFLLNCSGASIDKISYDKSLKKFKLERPLTKISIGVIHYKDKRKGPEVFENFFGVEKVTVTQMALKLTEEILKTQLEYVPITVIPILDIPPNNTEEYRLLKKHYGVDYIFIGEIDEAKIVKVQTHSPISYKLKIFLNKGFIPQTFTYESVVSIRGKLYSMEKERYIWEGTGTSKVREDKNITKDLLLVISLHNAIGKMLENMSKNFAISVKEIS
jgi:hypothetical protein